MSAGGATGVSDGQQRQPLRRQPAWLMSVIGMYVVLSQVFSSMASPTLLLLGLGLMGLPKMLEPGVLAQRGS